MELSYSTTAKVLNPLIKGNKTKLGETVMQVGNVQGLLEGQRRVHGSINRRKEKKGNLCCTNMWIKIKPTVKFGGPKEQI